MPLTLIADWLYPADPPPMKRLSEINQLHHGWPVTRPQFIGFTDFSFEERILFAPTGALEVMRLYYIIEIPLFSSSDFELLCQFI